MEKQYVMIHNAFRQQLHSRTIPDSVGVSHFSHREGHLGLIHPLITEFYADFKKNMRLSSGDSLLKSMSPPTRSFGYSFGFYEPSEDDIPVLVYGSGISSFGRRPDEFVVSMHKPGEYIALDETDLTESYKENYKQHVGSLPIFISSLKKDSLESIIESNRRHLDSFELLMPDKIHEILLENPPYSVSQEEVKHRKTFLRAVERTGRNRYR